MTSDGSIIIKEKMNLKSGVHDDMLRKDVVFKSTVPVKSCIIKINNTLIDNANNFDIVMPMRNLLEYSDNNDLVTIEMKMMMLIMKLQRVNILSMRQK